MVVMLDCDWGIGSLYQTALHVQSTTSSLVLDQVSLRLPPQGQSGAQRYLCSGQKVFLQLLPSQLRSTLACIYTNTQSLKKRHILCTH